MYGTFTRTNDIIFLYHTIPTFNDLEKQNLLKTLWEKEKMLVTSFFSFSHNVFYPFQNKFHFFGHTYFVVCKCFQFLPVQNFVVCIQNFTGCIQIVLTLFQTSPGCYMSAEQLLKTLWEKQKLLIASNTPFSTMFSILSENFLPFSSNLKLLSANSFILAESEIWYWGKV